MRKQQNSETRLKVIRSKNKKSPTGDFFINKIMKNIFILIFLSIFTNSLHSQNVYAYSHLQEQLIFLDEYGDIITSNEFYDKKIKLSQSHSCNRKIMSNY